MEYNNWNNISPNHIINNIHSLNEVNIKEELLNILLIYSTFIHCNYIN